MAVYTQIDKTNLDDLLAHYAIGELVAFEPITAGITNSNYFVDTTLGRWVLTLFEQMDAKALPFFMTVMDHLAAHGVPGAHPVARNDGAFLSQVQGRPAAFVHHLAGHSVLQPNATQCQSLGDVVAAMHAAAASLEAKQANIRGLDWIDEAAAALDGRLDAATQALLHDEIECQKHWAEQTHWQKLPQAVIHADIFRDNVLFDGNRVSGVIDFYYACHDYLLFDLAIICNDWCFDADMQFHTQRWQAFISSYSRRRALTAGEHDAWPAMLRAAALRFWTSRLYDYYFPVGDDVEQHDPRPYEQLLRLHRQTTLPVLP